jgi:hypothetical protein
MLQPRRDFLDAVCGVRRSYSWLCEIVKARVDLPATDVLQCGSQAVYQLVKSVAGVCTVCGEKSNRSVLALSYIAVQKGWIISSAGVPGARTR